MESNEDCLADVATDKKNLLLFTETYKWLIFQQSSTVEICQGKNNCLTIYSSYIKQQKEEKYGESLYLNEEMNNKGWALQ